MAEYLKMPHASNVKVLEFIECGITAKGCAVIGDLLSPVVLAPILVLRLDYNMIGFEGME